MSSQRVNPTALIKRPLILLTLVLLIAAPLAYAKLSRAALADDVVADSIRVEKAKRRLTLFRAGIALKSYRVALGGEPPRSEGTGRRQPHARGSVHDRLPRGG